MNPKMNGYYDCAVISESDDQLLYFLLLSGFTDHVWIQNAWVEEDLMIEQITIGPYGVWILGTKYTGGVIYNVNGNWFKEPSSFIPGEITAWKPVPVSTLEAEWLREKKAAERVLHELVPRVIEAVPGLIKGGVCLAHHDYGETTIFPAIIGNEDMFESEILLPLDKHGDIVEPIITIAEINKITMALIDRSRSIHPDPTTIIECFLDQNNENGNAKNDTIDDSIKDLERDIWKLLNDYIDDDEVDDDCL
ncbi:MAG: hypothetical protein KAU23_11275 [Anaerolineales bacterium]|nr:hypothetical protein [Anaerolineales bacterium]